VSLSQTRAAPSPGQFGAGFAEQLQAAVSLGSSHVPQLQRLMQLLKRLEDPLRLQRRQAPRGRPGTGSVERDLAAVYAGAGLAAGVSLAPATGGASVAASIGLASMMMMAA